MDGALSELLDIYLGVPQGSILGPFLFLVYINDLPDASNYITKLFADDTCLVFSANNLKELQTRINFEMKKVEDWMSGNKLSLNHTKTNFMLINKKGKQSAINLYINNTKIKQVNEIKYLGITIDSTLSWKSHIKQVEKKLSRACGMISKLRYYVNAKCLRSFYYAKVYSYLQYAVLAWGGCCDKSLDKINKIHNKIVRMMTLIGPLRGISISNNALYKNANLLQLKQIHKLELAKLIHRAAYKSLPSGYNTIFLRIQSIRHVCMYMCMCIYVYI